MGSAGIDGTLKYIADYSAAGYAGSEAKGHYLVLHVDVPNVTGVTYTVEVLGGAHGPQTLDEDQTAICYIKDTTKRIKITATKSGVTETRIFRLNGLTLA